MNFLKKDGGSFCCFFACTSYGLTSADSKTPQTGCSDVCLVSNGTLDSGNQSPCKRAGNLLLGRKGIAFCIHTLLLVFPSDAFTSGNKRWILYFL